jgi:hypothetical protein
MLVAFWRVSLSGITSFDVDVPVSGDFHRRQQPISSAIPSRYPSTIRRGRIAIEVRRSLLQCRSWGRATPTSAVHVRRCKEFAGS